MCNLYWLTIAQRARLLPFCWKIHGMPLGFCGNTMSVPRETSCEAERNRTVNLRGIGQIGVKL